MTAVRCSVDPAEADIAARHRALAEARAWIGTPYCHQASRKGAGTDCLGLLRGVWRVLYGTEPELPPPYTPDWAEIGAGEDILAAAGRHLIARPIPHAGLGDVLVFRMRRAGPAKHVAILASPWLEPGRIVHAYSGHAVAETHLTPAWLTRIAGAFRFPAV